MTMYPWHMVPVLILGALMVVAGLPTGPRAGTVAWWLLRVLWIGVLALLLVGVIGLVGRFEGPGRPRPHLSGWMPSTLLLVCAALTGYALSRLALDGFAPSGRLAVVPLAVFATGMLALWLAGRAEPPRLVGSGESGGIGGDYKSVLQELVQRRGEPLPEYVVAAEDGPAHRRLFRIEVRLQGAVLASAQGTTKKEAEQQAARLALERMSRADGAEGDAEGDADA
jgi:hypothetical protein